MTGLHASRGAAVGALAYVSLVLLTDFGLAANTLQPTPVPLSGVVQQVGFALLVGAATGATFAYAIAGSSITASSYFRAGGTCSGHGGVAQWLATARCDDGTLSLSTTGKGTCANHGGVAVWYAIARCEDGTWSHAATRRGACSGHGGVAEWFEDTAP